MTPCNFRESFIVFIISLLLLTACKDVPKKSPYVISMDIKEMAALHLPDFSISLEHSDSMRYNYTFIRSSDSAQVNIVLEIFESSVEAIEAAQNSLEYISVPFEEGSYNGKFIGDKFWWHSYSSTPDIVTNIVFCRTNVFFMLNCYPGYFGLVNFASNIDLDILNEAAYIQFK